MAAPDAAISTVRAAVATPGDMSGGSTTVQVAYAPSGQQGQVSRPGSGRAGDPAWVLGGSESRELGKLRETRSPDEGRERASCDLDRPMYSRPPRYVSAQGRDAVDVDDLDTTGVEALSRLQLPDLKVSISKRTLKYVRFFTRSDRGRGMFESWLSRSGRYQDMIQHELREWRLPEDLQWVAMIESGFDPRAKSPAGAVGLWQFMPATGEVYGLTRNLYMDARRNPRLATQAAAHHLRDLYMRFGSWDLALAAYNMGYEQLLDAIDRYGTTDFNELARQQAIPSETASYVPKIAAAAIVANNLERFGFDKVEIKRPIDAAEIAVPPGTPMRTIAKAAGVSTATIRTLNPDILGEKVPPGRGDYLVMIPSDAFSRATAALPAMLEHQPPESDASVLDPVSLLSGRELSSVGRSRRGEESLLSLLPPPKKRRTLRDPGDELAERLAREDDREEEDYVPVRPRPKRARSGREVVMYRVGPGDTLVGIARQFAADIEDVARENDLETDAKLRVGALLKLRVRREMIEGAQGAEGRSSDAKGEAKGDAKGEEREKSGARDRGEKSSADRDGGKSGDEKAEKSEKGDRGKSDRSERGARGEKRESRKKTRG
jgi:membrane-bound lytic murein transglycosylase D